MGNYLNTTAVYDTYRREHNSPYFVDKSKLLCELCPRVDTTANYICVTRPRRFGKSMAANMMAAFFSRACDSEALFHKLKAEAPELCRNYLGRYDVIFISFNEMPRNCKSYGQYIERIENRLLQDLMEAYPEAGIRKGDAVWDAFLSVYQVYDSKRFLFVFDEWDFIFHRPFVSQQDKADYIDF